MNRIICKLAFRESGMYIVPVLVTLFCCVIFPLDPLRYFDVPVAVLSALLGFFLAWRSFADYGHVRAFLFSRAFTPKRFFLVRWLFGLGIIFGTGIVVTLLIALGIRQGVQELLFKNGWFPMIRFEELHVLVSYVFASLFTYHTTLYFMLTNRFRAPVRLRGWRFWLRGLGTLLLLLFAAVVILTALCLGAAIQLNDIGLMLEFECFLYLIFGLPVLLQLILTPWFGVYCYRNQEIES